MKGVSLQTDLHPLHHITAEGKGAATHGREARTRESSAHEY